jgi:hypothetical protein
LLAGDDLQIAPRFVPPPSDIAASVADQTALLAGDATAPAAWLGKAAAVRAPLAPLERALLTADVLAPAGAALGLRVAQLPFAAGDAWIGLDRFDPDHTIGRRSFAVHAPLGLELDGPVAGLLVDAWADAVPAPVQTTGVAFQIEQPAAAPPQLVVLAVPGDLSQPTWTDAAVEDVIRETLALADLRLVDGDLIDAGGHYLPGLYFAVNLAGETASTDFTGTT